MAYEYVKSSRDRRKKQIVKVMGDYCQLCGYSKSDAALELHHINPSEKEFTFNKELNTAWNKLEIELKKCILLCANCHREVHFSGEIFNLISSFNQEKFSEIAMEINKLKKHELSYCKDCGILIHKRAERCPNCANLVKRIAERPNREELKSLIRAETFVAIGNKYQVSDNTIRKWCQSEGLPFTKREIKSYSDKEWLLI